MANFNAIQGSIITSATYYQASSSDFVGSQSNILDRIVFAISANSLSINALTPANSQSVKALGAVSTLEAYLVKNIAAGTSMYMG